MNRKRLTIYDFGKKIMSDIESFNFVPKSIKPKYPNNEHSEIYSLVFLWEWNGYNGYGTIDYNNHTNELCNEFGENSSKLVIHSDSRRQAQKNISELYNDPSLAELFDMILKKTDLQSRELLKET